MLTTEQLRKKKWKKKLKRQIIIQNRLKQFGEKSGPIIYQKEQKVKNKSLWRSLLEFIIRKAKTLLNFTKKKT